MTGVRSGERASGRSPSRLKTTTLSGAGRGVLVGVSVSVGKAVELDSIVGARVAEAVGGRGEGAGSTASSAAHPINPHASSSPGVRLISRLKKRFVFTRSAFTCELVPQANDLANEQIEIFPSAAMIGDGAAQSEAALQHGGAGHGRAGFLQPEE